MSTSNIGGSTSATALAAKKWEDAQEKAFTNWVNTLLSKKGEKVENIATDFADGVKLIHFLELISGKQCKRKYNPDPKDKINKIQNLHIALSFLYDDLQLKSRSAGAEDFYDNNRKMIFGLFWTLYRKFRISSIKGTNDGNDGNNGSGANNNNNNNNNREKDPSEKESEDNLLKWCSNMTGMNMTQFKSGFRDGMAFLEMAKSFSDPQDAGLLDSFGGAGVDSIARLNAVFDFAEKNLNIPKILDAEDLVSGIVDERTVMLYTSMFYNAYEGRKKQSKSETEELIEKVMECSEVQKETIQKIFRLEETLNMYNEELRLQRLERMAMEKMVRQQENDSFLSNLLILRDNLEDHQLKLCKLQQRVQEAATGKLAPLWGPSREVIDLTLSEYDQIEMLGELLQDETNRINRIVQVTEVKPIAFIKKSKNIDDNDGGDTIIP